MSAFHRAAYSGNLFLAAVKKGNGHFAVTGMSIIRENRGSNLSIDGVFGGHLSKSKGESEGDVQNMIFNIV